MVSSYPRIARNVPHEILREALPHRLPIAMSDRVGQPVDGVQLGID
jgi:hypothetical protein